MKIIPISPNRDDVASIIKMSSEYSANLYPPESNHQDDLSELSKPNVFFIDAFERDNIRGIGAVKVLSHDRKYGEIKQIFVLPEHRSKGAAKLIMAALEKHLIENGIRLARLETGCKQPEAISLYKKIGYIERSPFGEYKPDPLSIFMEKELSAAH
jgi:putative acetyltransferase